MKDSNNLFNLDKINTVEMKLLNGQVEIILRSLELYAYNLEYMLNGSELENDTKQEKLAMLKYTYLGKNMLKNNNIFNIIPDKKDFNIS